MKKIFSLALLMMIIFSATVFAAEPILQASSGYKVDAFSNYYKYDVESEAYSFQPLSKIAYKNLSKQGKISYKKVKLAQRYWLRGNSEKNKYKQIEYYNKAINLNPDLHPLIYELAYYYGNDKKDYKVSNYYLNKLYKFRNIYPEYSYIGAINAYNLNDYKNAIIFAKYYLSLGEKVNKESIPQVNYMVAQSALSLSDYTEAIAYANQIINNPEYRANALDIKYIANFNLKKYGDALVIARELVKIYPNNPQSYLRIAACSDNKQEKLSNLYNAKVLQIIANDKRLFLTDSLIAELEQEKINKAVKGIKSFFVKPDWIKIQNGSPRLANDGFYWSKRQDNFFNNTNNCIAKYKGNELCKCFEAVNQEQSRLSMQRQKDIELQQQRDIANLQLLQQERALQIQQINAINTSMQLQNMNNNLNNINSNLNGINNNTYGINNGINNMYNYTRYGY